jgi:2-iminobutanoate/2-iminopropanoate deaminase
MKERIHTDNAPQAIGPYNQAIVANGMVYVSGQIPFTEGGVLVSDGIRQQTRQSLTNIQLILEKAGTGKEKIVKTTIFLQDMNDFSSVNEEYAAFFEGTVYPARATVEVSKLPKDVKVEIEAIALL